MLNKIKSIWPREEGQNWNTPKFHETRHTVDDLIQNGAPAGTNSRPKEDHLIKTVKRPSERTQKRGECFDFQLGKRNYESYILYTGIQYMETINPEFTLQCEEAPTDPKLSASNGILKFKIENDTEMSYYAKGTMKVNKEMLQFLLNDYAPVQEAFLTNNHIQLDYFSEYKRNNEVF